MRALLAPALCLMLLSGCIADTETTRTNSVNGSDRSLHCVNGECEVCVDGACAPCEGRACDDCMDTDHCPALEAQAQGDVQPAPVPDTSVDETHDLALGLERTTWRWNVAEGGVANAYLRLHGAAVPDVVADGDHCIEWAWRNGGSSSEGNHGACAQGGVYMSINGPRIGEDTIFAWEGLGAGSYEVSFRTPPQANVLVVDIVADNP